MAPGRPTPTGHMSFNGNGTATPPLNGHGNSNGRRRPNRGTQRRNRRQQAEQAQQLHGLPEYLYDSYERLYNIPRDGTSSNSSRMQTQLPPLLIDAYSGNEVTYTSFRALAATLATSLGARNHVAPGDTIAILATSNINVPIVATAAWLLGACVVVLSPHLYTDELYALLSQQPSPRSFFVSRALRGTAAQLITNLGLLHSEVRPHIVVFDAYDDDYEFQAPREQQVPGVRGGLWELEELYISRPGEYPIERLPLTLSEAQEHIAIIYYSHIVEANDQYDVTAISLSHENVISHYNGPLRRSPSLPDTTTITTPPSHSSSATPRSQTPISRTPSVYGVEPYSQLDDDSGPAPPNPTAYSVLRMHQAYRLHRIIFDIFCRGASYIVAPQFVSAEFVSLVDRYAIRHAELTFAEMQSLIGYLQAHDLDQPLPRRDWPLHAVEVPEGSTPADYFLTTTIGSMLGTLRYIYTESERTQTELAPTLVRLLPQIEIVRTRFGSYVEPPVNPR